MDRHTPQAPETAPDGGRTARRSMRRLIAAAAVLSVTLVAQLVMPSTVDAGESPHPWDVDYSSWMSDHRDVLDAKRLVDIPIPASHDTLMFDASFELSPDAPFDIGATLIDAFDGCPSELASVCDPVLQGLLDLAVPLGNRFTHQWGQTQDRDLTEQLEDGIRSFDMRVCRKPDGSLYGCHGVYTRHDIAWHLDQIRAFLEEHGDEIVLISVSVVDGGGWSDDDGNPYDRAELAAAIDAALGPWLATDPTLIARPMSEIWAGPGRVFMFTGDLELHADSGYMIHPAGSYTIGSWPNSSDVASMQEAVFTNLRHRQGTICDSNCGAADPNKLFGPSANLTPQTDDIVLGIVAQMLDMDSTLRGLWITAAETAAVFGKLDELFDLLGGDPLDPRVPMGVDDVPLSEGGVRRGMWGHSMDGLYGPILDAVSRDPVLRRNLNRMGIDHYHRVPGYVAAIVALATSDHREDNLIHNGEPALTVVSRTGYQQILPPRTPSSVPTSINSRPRSGRRFSTTTPGTNPRCCPERVFSAATRWKT